MDLELTEISGNEAELEKEPTPKNRPDLLPEYCHYQDEGCEYADACLNCPFPQCLYDEPRGKQRWLKRLRNREISKLLTGVVIWSQPENDTAGIKEHIINLIFETGCGSGTEG